MMKRYKFLAIILVFVLTVIPVFASHATTGAYGYVVDETGSMDQEVLTQLDAYAYEISRKHNCGVYFVMVDTYTKYTEYYDEDIIDATANYYHRNSFGAGDGRDGMLIFVSQSDSELGSYVYGDWAEYALNVHGQMQIEDAALVGFGIGDWAMGVEDYLTACDKAFAMAEEGEPLRESRVGEIGLIYVVAFGIGFIYCLVEVSKHKTAKMQSAAAQYITSDGLLLTENKDHYLRTSVTRVKKSTDSGSGSGGSRRVQGGSGRSRKF